MSRFQFTTVEIKVSWNATATLGASKCHIARARLDQRWIDFLLDTCHLPISRSNSDFVIRTYSSRPPRTAQLTSKIEDFLKQYKRKNNRYSVVLVRNKETGGQEPLGSCPLSTLFYDTRYRTKKELELIQQSGQFVAPSILNVWSIPSSSQQNPDIRLMPPPPPPGPSGSVIVRRASSSSSGQGQLPMDVANEVEVKTERSSDDAGDEEDDQMSVVTGVEEQERELRQRGIVMEEVKPEVTRKLGYLSNGFYKRMHFEISRLERNLLWQRNVTRAPMASYFVKDLLFHGTLEVDTGSGLKHLVVRNMDRVGNNLLLRVKQEILRLIGEEENWKRNVNRSPLTCYLLCSIFGFNCQLGRINF